MSNNFRIDQVTQMINGAPVQINVMRDWFCYTFPVVSSIAPSTASRNIVNIQADAVFICEKITCFADIAGAVQTVETQVIPLVTLQLNDSASGRNLFSDALPIASVCGQNLAGYTLPLPRCFAPNGTVQATFYNYSAATTYENLYLVMHGYKEWRLN